MTKIVSVEVIALEQDPDAKNRGILCRINTQGGISGYGEAAVAIGCGGPAAFELIKDLVPMIIGQDALDHEVLWEKMFKSSFWGIGNGAIEMAAISAIDIALWDIKGKHFGVPVYKLLGGKQRNKLRCYASQIQFGWACESFSPFRAPSGSPAFYADAAQKAAAQGYDALKANFMRFDKDGFLVSPAESTGLLSREMLELAESRIEAVGDAIGPKVDILVENHALTDASTGLQIANICEKYDVMLLEEPTHPLNAGLFKKIQRKTDIPLATGERTYTRFGFIPYFENHSLTCIQPDIGNCGGITEAKKICDMAYAYDIGVQTHVCSSALSVAISLQLEAVIPNFYIHEMHLANTTPFNLEQFQHQYLPDKDGCLAIPELPGIGNEPTKEALSKARIETVK